MPKYRVECWFKIAQEVTAGGSPGTPTLAKFELTEAVAA